jgi:hypothetical protein
MSPESAVMAGLRHLDRSSRRVRDGWAFLLGLASLAALALPIGCTSRSLRPQPQPPVTIVVRNDCGIDLRTVSLRGPALADGQANWLGTISPVPRGTRQILGRRSAAFPWPSVVEVVWTDDRQREYSRKIALELLLKQATGTGPKTLTVEIHPDGELAVYPGGR